MKIHIPTPLRVYTGQQESVTVDAPSVDAALQQLAAAHPDLRNHLFTPEGKLRSFVNVYLNDDDIRYLPAKEATPVVASDELTIIPSIAGGTGRPGSRAARPVVVSLRLCCCL
jgi:adenylyltransferase/sulfurtransferase